MTSAILQILEAVALLSQLAEVGVGRGVNVCREGRGVLLRGIDKGIFNEHGRLRLGYVELRHVRRSILNVDLYVTGFHFRIVTNRCVGFARHSVLNVTSACTGRGIIRAVPLGQ